MGQSEVIVNNGYGYPCDKTKELILYVAEFLADKPGYGATLLNKALYFIDNISYINTGKPISNLDYIKQEFGPTPKPSQFLKIKQEMLLDKELEEKKFDAFGRVQKKCFALRSPNLDVFDKNEIVIMDKVLNQLTEHNATSISNISHKVMAWEVASMMEDLPLNTYLLSSKSPTEEDVQWATEKIKSYQH